LSALAASARAAQDERKTAAE
jgi:hypothetical protein